MSFAGGTNTVLTRQIEGIDRPPAIPNSMDDEFYGSSLDAKWSWLDQGGATAVVDEGLLSFSLTENVNRIRGIYQAAPVGAWTFQAKVLKPLVQSGNSHSCLFAGQGAGASDDQHGVAWFGSQHFPLTWASPSSNAGAWISQQSFNVMQQAYYEISFNGTNTLAVRQSNDGVDWLAWAGQVIAYTPAIVGLGFGNASGELALYEFEWFRRTA